MELNQFCILARTQKGRACAALVQQVNHIYLEWNTYQLTTTVGFRPQEDICFW